MKRSARLLFYVAIGLATGLVLAVVVIYTASRTPFGMERVRRFAVSWLEERTEGTIRIGRITGRGLMGGLTLHEFAIVDEKGRPFLATDSAHLAYNWRTFVSGQIVIDRATLFNPRAYLEQLPGDSIWNYEHIFPERGDPGAPSVRRVILINNVRIVDGLALIRSPYEPGQRVRAVDTVRTVVEAVPGGLAKVVRFDSINGLFTRVVWESPDEPGKLFDIRDLRAHSYLWREPMRLTGLRGTVTWIDTIIGFEVPDVRLPSSRATVVGRVIMQEGLNRFDVRADSRQFSFRDLQWLYPRLPDNGGGSATLRIQSQQSGGILWLATNARIAAPGTRLSGDFGVVTGDSIYFTNVNLRASPLNLEFIESLLPGTLPVDGLLVGTVEVKGPLSSLETKGDMQLAHAGERSSMKWQGTVDVERGVGAENFRADVRQLDLALLNLLRPDLNLRGRVTGTVEASGHLDRSVRFAADIHHYLSGYASSFEGSGTYTAEGRALDVRLNARPLSLQELAKSYPALQRLQGEARGPIHLTGDIDNLAVTADLETRAGRTEIQARLTRANSKARYTGEAKLHSFQLDRLVSELPATSLTGIVAFDLSGTSLANAAGRVSARFSEGELSSSDFRDAQAAMKLERGQAHVDSFSVQTTLGEIRATGAFGLTADAPGKLEFTINTDSLTSVANATDDDESAGVVRITGTAIGSVHSFDLDANIDLRRLRYGPITASQIAGNVNARALGTAAGFWELRARADSLIAFGEPADTALLTGLYSNGRGALHFGAGRQSGEEYVATAGVQRRTPGYLFSIGELRLGPRNSPWALIRPADVFVDEHGLLIDSLEIRRAEGGRASATGRLAWHDTSHEPEPGIASNFSIDFEGVPFSEFARVAWSGEEWTGVLNGHVRVLGNAVSPRMEGTVAVTALRNGDAALERAAGGFTYADRKLNLRAEAHSAGRRVLFSEGIIPIDLAFVPMSQRRLAQPMQVSLTADSLPASFVTWLADGFTAVRGRIDGTLVAAGTTQTPELSGALSLHGGAARWSETGVNYRDIVGTFRLEGDRFAHVAASLKANGGEARAIGTLEFKQPGDPVFDLVLHTDAFLAAKRRDAEFTASGQVHLEGSYRAPRISGNIEVSEGALFLDELYRRYQVVELDNPLLYDVVDTSIVSLRSFLPRSQNPFVKNLTINDLRVNVARDVWLRSRDLNMQLNGEVAIDYLDSNPLSGQRSAQDLTLIGTLQAVRGTYHMYLGQLPARQFAIREGVVEFPGTPGLDPNLGINAVYRARPSQGEPIDIIAVVSGTLRSPRIRLTSDEQPPISESDLTSYLFFGVPTYALSPGQSSQLAITSTGFSYLSSGLQQLGLPFDYVSLTAADEPQLGTHTTIESLFRTQRLEIGWYPWTSDLYVAATKRLANNGWPGLRVEWTVVPRLTAELFSEERFARSPGFGIQDPLEKRVYGFFLFREWAY